VSKVDVSGFVTISLNAIGDRTTPTLGDVREWIIRCDELRISDDTELLEGMLSIDIPVHSVEPITCGECNLDDILVLAHDCQGYIPQKETPKKQDKKKKK
jgi:hypothetical protein